MALRKKGFTLIELLVVMVILGLLVGIVGPRVMRRIKPAKIQAAKVQVASLEQALQHYYLENNAAYPASLEALVPEYIEGIPMDPWGKPYAYHFPGSHNKDFDIESGGPDGAIGGEDDVTNYTK
ncbi:MAG: type II secretion system major pseudopilin GspG [Candidatus Aureabacteria bacterium]|nr:type II secretion system major pseudopilin GspG [Candidatus Auribacterota bacterium]